MVSFTRGQLLAFILLFGFCARAITYKAPLLDHHAWRQADTAAIARNFTREAFNPFLPQVDWRGASPVGYVETGFELFAFLAAIVSKMAGGFHAEIGRVLATLCFVASGVLLEAFVRRRYGETIGLTAAFVYAFGFPLALFMERAFMNEPLLICLSIACLRATQVYLDRGSPSALAALIVSSALVATIKLPYLIVWAPVVGLFVERDGLRAARRPGLLLVLAVDVVAAVAWYLHAHRLGASTGLSFLLTDKLFDAALVFSPAFVVQIGRQLLKDVFGITAVFFLVGLADAVRHRRLCELFAVGGYLAYLIIVARGNFVHDYYQLPIIVIAPTLAALGLVRSTAWLASRTGRSSGLISASLLAAVVVSTLLRSISAHSWYEIDGDVAQACQQSRDFLRPDDRLLFVDNNDPQVMFCMDRHGWLLSDAQSDEPRLAAAASGGATVAVLLRAKASSAGAAWVAAHGTSIYENPAILAYRLTR